MCLFYILFVHCTQSFHEIFQKTDPARVIQSTPEISHVRQHSLSDVMGSGRKELRHNPWIHRSLFQDICQAVQDHIFTVLRTDYLLYCTSVRPRSCLYICFCGCMVYDRRLPWSFVAILRQQSE